MSTITCNTVRWASAQATGTDHLASDIGCQDAVSVRSGEYQGLPVIVAVVADGAGSAVYADIGSTTAVSVFSEFVLEEFAAWGLDGLEDLMLDAAAAVQAALRRRAATYAAGIEDFATTLLAAVSVGDDTAFLQIGDGGIVTGPSWTLVFEPQHGEYRNETHFITDADAFDWIRQARHSRPLEAMMLFTDGLEDLLIHSGSRAVHPPLFEQLAASLAHSTGGGRCPRVSADLTRLLHSPDITTRTDDDTTLVAVLWAT